MVSAVRSFCVWGLPAAYARRTRRTDRMCEETHVSLGDDLLAPRLWLWLVVARVVDVAYICAPPGGKYLFTAPPFKRAKQDSAHTYMICGLARPQRARTATRKKRKFFFIYAKNGVAKEVGKWAQPFEMCDDGTQRRESVVWRCWDIITN